MKTVYYTATSLDGFLADEHHSLDWLFQFGQVAGMEEHYPRFLAKVGAIAMGSHTYEWLVEHEDLVAHPERWPYTLPTWVFSSRALPVLPGADIRFARGDVGEVHAAMVAAAGGKNVWLTGGGELVGQFHERGLLDELVVTVAPVTLGRGAPLLPRRISAPPLRLRDVERFGEVYVVLTYAVDKGDA